MSDYANMCREMRQERQRIRNNNLMVAESQIDLSIFTKHNTYHYSTMLRNVKLQYWPSSRKWNWNGRTHHGSYQDLMSFIGKRLDEDEK